MTTNATFKRRVRERMSRTGERYTTARAHLLADHAPSAPDGLLPGWSRTGGLQPDLAAVANALAHVGAVGPTGDPLDEVDALGLSGGIGFMYALFVYEGHEPTLTLTTRVDSMPDVSATAAVGRAGVDHDVVSTGSAAKAGRLLAEAIDAHRPVLVTLDESVVAEARTVPRSATDLPGMPRVVGVVGRDAEGRWLVDDMAPDPATVDAEVLETARGSLPRSTHHAIEVGTVVPEHDPVAGAVAALRATVEGYDEPPAKPFAKNVGTRGLHTWADAMVGGDRRSWSQVFPDVASTRTALRRVAEWVDADLTAPGASRGLWATFVERVADGTGRPGLSAVAEAARASEWAWLELATVAREAAADDGDPTGTRRDLADRVRDVAGRERALLDDLAAELGPG